MRELPALAFEGAVVDQQTFLDGTREFTVDAASEASDGAPWELTLTFRWPKEEDAQLNEGDLTLTAPDGGALYATLRSGTAESVIDDETDAEVTQVDLRFGVGSGEGAYAGAAGEVRLFGTLAGEEARLAATVMLEH
jgi:hypothetical protein